MQEAIDNAVAIKGCYVKIYIVNFPLNLLPAHDKEKPLIISSLLKYEHKISLLNWKIKRTAEFDIDVRSKEELELHHGFRILKTKPIFSKIFGVMKDSYKKY